MKISVIIPVYKVEKYLDACVQSVFSQSYTDTEIILIDDGSPDYCPKLCDEYALSDSRVKVVHKPNGGLSDARNAGIRVATGDYLIFLDSDDYWLDTDFLNQLVVEAKATQLPDIVLFRHVDYYEESNQFVPVSSLDPQRIRYCNRNEVFEYLVTGKLFYMSACLLLIKKDLLLDNQVFFETGLLGEDMDWILKLWSNVRSVGTIDCFAYCYRHRPASITTTYNLKNVQDFSSILNKWLEKAQLIEDIRFARLLLGYLAFLYTTLVRNFYLVDRSGRSEEYKLLKKLLPLLEYSLTSKSDQLLIVKKCLGFRITVFLFGLYGLLSKKGISGLKLLFK